MSSIYTTIYTTPPNPATTSDPTIVRVGDAEGFDKYTVAEILKDGRKRIADGVPLLYADAVVTIPEVDEWVRSLVAIAVDNCRVGEPMVRSGPSILLMGPCGVGKTYNAYGAMRALSASGVHAWWRVEKSTQLFRAMRPRPGHDSERYLREVMESKLLVLDDLGAARSNPSREETLYDVVDFRNEHRLPTLFTTNIADEGETMSAVVGERVASRLDEMCAVAVALTGEDRRRDSDGVS